MTEYITNRLHFITNTEVILKYIKARKVHDDPPPEFSLNAIKSMPDDLFVPLDAHIKALSVLNMEMPSLDEDTKKSVQSSVFLGTTGKTSETAIQDAIASTRKSLIESSSDTAGLEPFDKVVSNYNQYGFFSQYDWRFANWGTIEDIHSVTEKTFKPPTDYLEFTTRWAPPIPAMQELANTFPSVRFKLRYRHLSDDNWITVDIFGFPPWGY